MSASSPPFEKILVANRGEIAVRVIRAAHELGMRAVAVYSEADRGGLHVRYADEAVLIGPPEPLRSYLDQERIVQAARATGAGAVHPGYGFLAENAAFARRVVEAGLVFVGPPPAAIEGMGDKIRSRELMEAAKVPVVPGRAGVTRKNLAGLAAEVGYPLMLKAAAGGGGKGIRIVHSEGELLSAFERAQGEAHTAFGNPTVYLERFLENPHHIEFQVLADNHGKVVHLLERECSVQRRHQKVIEEAPSPFMTDELRESMGRAAVQAARAIGYQNAGTVEFLVDAGREFYFLEMNTRLQVEHPVTEMITGEDLVRWQLRIAAGEELTLRQEDVSARGHAIEVRICAEDPENDFLPAVGRVDTVCTPGGPGVRLDSGLFAGLEVSLYYDPMLAKLVVWGSDRGEALARARRALTEFKVADLKTNIAFCGRILRQPEFAQGRYDTGIIPRMGDPAVPRDVAEAAALAAALVEHERGARTRRTAEQSGAGLDPWKLVGRRRSLGGRRP